MILGDYYQLTRELPALLETLRASATSNSGTGTGTYLATCFIQLGCVEPLLKFLETTPSSGDLWAVRQHRYFKGADSSGTAANLAAMGMYGFPRRCRS